MCPDQESNLPPFDIWTTRQPTGPHQPAQFFFISAGLSLTVSSSFLILSNPSFLFHIRIMASEFSAGLILLLIISAEFILLSCLFMIFFFNFELLLGEIFICQNFPRLGLRRFTFSWALRGPPTQHHLKLNSLSGNLFRQKERI